MYADSRPLTYFIRVYDDGKSYDNKDPYKAIFHITVLDSCTCYAQGFRGTDLGIEGIFKAYGKLYDQGFRTLLYEKHNKTVTVDLVRLRKKGKI